MFRSTRELRARPPSRRPIEPSKSRYIETGGGGAAGSSRVRFARITARAGTEAPFEYNGVRVTRTGGDWEEVEDAEDLSWALRNLAEAVGDLYAGNPVEDESIVAYWPAGDGTFWFERSAYKGTYP